MANETKFVITANTAQAEAAMGRLGTSLSGVTKNILSFGGVAATLTGALSITAFAGFIKSSIDAADRLGDLSKSTGIMVEDLAGLKLLAEQSGTSLETLAKAINKMSVEIGKDPEKFRALGVTATENTEAFKQFSDVFSKISDLNLRNALAQEVFGRSWDDLAPALSEGSQKIGEIIDKGKRLSGITADMTKEADAFNDTMAELKTMAGGAGTSLALPIVSAMNEIIKAMQEATKEGSYLKTIIVGLGGLGAALYTDDLKSEEQKIIKRINELKSQLGKTSLFERIERPLLHPLDTLRGATLNAPSAKEREAELASLEKRLEKLRKPKIEPLKTSSGTIDTHLEEAACLAVGGRWIGGKCVKKSNGRTGGGSDPAVQIRAQEQATLLAMKKQIDGYGEMTKAEQVYWETKFGAYKKFNPLVQQELLAQAQIIDGIEAQTEATKALAEYDKMVEQVFIGSQEDFNRKLQGAYDILSDVDIVFRAGQEWEKLLKIQAQFPEIISMEQIGQKYAQMFDTHKNTMDGMSEYARQAGRNIQDAFAEFLFDPFNSSLGGLVQNFEMALRKMAAQALSSHILDWVGEWGKSQSGEGGLMGFFGDLLGGMFEARAIGGAVNPGQTFLVGERGPELFRPASSGTVIPNGNFGGMTVVNNFTLMQPADRRTQEQIATLAGLSVQSAMARNA